MIDPIRSLTFGTGLKFQEFTITYSDLTTAGLTQAINLVTLPAGSGFILGVRLKHSVQFAAPVATSLTVSVGSSAAGAAGYASAWQILSVAVADTTFQMTTQFNRGTAAAEIVQATFTAIGGNVNTMTAGSVTIGVLYGVPTDPTSW